MMCGGYDKAVGIGFMVREEGVKCGMCGGYDKAVGVGFIHGEGEMREVWACPVAGAAGGGLGGGGRGQGHSCNRMGWERVWAWAYARRSLLSMQLPFLQTLALQSLC